MSQPDDLGEIWSLVSRAPKFSEGDLFYMAGVSPDGDMDHSLLQVTRIGAVTIDARILGDRLGLKEDAKAPMISVPKWATLGKTSVQ